MIALLLFAQLAGAIIPDSAYTTPALRAMVAAAADSNRVAPVDLRAYRAHVESEMSLLIRDTLGREHSAEIEQFATTASWQRSGRYDLHVTGYRSQSVGVPYSTLTIIRAWTTPVLYGNRLTLGAYFTRSRTGDTLIAVHPFAPDRDQYYLFSGGDTVTVLRIAGRLIHIARIRVQPRFRSQTKLGVFDGEIDIDAERGQIVRMRGQIMITRGMSGRRPPIAHMPGIVAAAFVEFVNAEVAGKYWLPAFQRTEFQTSVGFLGQQRPAFRIVSRFSDMHVDASPDSTTTGDSLPPPHVVVSWAPPDSLNAFNEWANRLGVESAAVHSDDFQDLAPDAWRPTGTPRLDLFPVTVSQVLRFNRVEGLYTGIAPTLDFRSAAPGLSMGAYGGWAWTEQTVRGGTHVTYHRAPWTVSAIGERTLATTNDFVPTLGQDPGINALLASIDDYDYVDRRLASLSLTRVFGALSDGLATLQAGIGDDRAERVRLSRGLFLTGDGFRPNRNIEPGTYAHVVANLELHPNVTGDFVQPGFGARAHYELGAGDLDWQRLELNLAERRYWGPLSMAFHADGGIVVSNHPPPQTLFELGGSEALPGYDYKQFAGDRAALFRTFASYRFPIWKMPLRVWKYVLPGFSPGVAASIQGGWTEISSAAAQAAVAELGADSTGAPISDATHGVRATLGGGLTFFSDVVHVGVARSLDRGAPWKFVAGFGTTF
jgi:hypothetical protein